MRVAVVRGLGAPALIAIGLSVLGASIYFVLGAVAEKALGLTPLVFLVAGLLFLITVMTYLEGNSVHPERGGASMFARYAFDELWSFVAGWAILLDYLIVMALGAVTVPHYLAIFWEKLDDRGFELAIVAGVIGFVASANIRGISANRLQRVLRIGLVNAVLLFGIVVIGLVTEFHPERITDSIELGTTPPWEDVLFAATVAAIVVIGIESASGLAGEIRVGTRGLRRVVMVASTAIVTLFVGISVVALMVVPVENGMTALGTTYLEDPVRGVVEGLSPEWLRSGLLAAVGTGAFFMLTQAVNGNMLGLSRVTYSLATNRQIPSALGRLGKRSTPYVAILAASVIVLALAASASVKFLVGIFAFGAMISTTIAHASIVVLRFREPDRRRAFRVPFSVGAGKGSVPLPAAFGVVLGLAAWVSVLVVHEGARYVGGAWMLAGLTLYVVYRRSQGKSLTERFTIPAEALGEPPDVEYGSILVPVFGGPLDDDIVGTAGRLAAEEADDEEGAIIEACYVIEMPMSVPIDASVPDERMDEARRALARAKEVGEEYEGVEVKTFTVRGRTAGSAIVAEAKRRGVEAIVLAAEEPSRTRGGPLLGGLGGPRDKFADEVTRYVLEKAPSRVILTAAPAGEEGEREGVAP